MKSINHSGRSFKQILVTLLIGFAGGIMALSVNSLFIGNSLYTGQIQKNDSFAKFTNNVPVNENIDFTEAADRTVHAVVHVMTQLQGYDNPFYSYFFGDNQGGVAPLTGTGSGVIISSDGYIVTNNHVIENAQEVKVVLNDKRTYKAKLIGTDPSTDLALLKIDEKDLPTIPFGSSDNLKIGEWVLAVGNPFNLTSTVTAGIVSAKARNINILRDKGYAVESFIQTDAAVNPGNSGGALVNTKGELVGINAAIASRTGSYSGYSFAIPVSIVQKVVADLIEFGTVQRALLGVNIRDIDAELAKELKLEKIEGVYVADVTENGAAKEAGIQKDDIITKVGDMVVNKMSELQEQINKFRPGAKVKITLKRANKILELQVTLKNQEGGTNFINRQANDMLGATFEKISDQEKANLRIKYGVKITELKPGKLLRAGIEPGFIITLMNNQPVDSYEDVQRIVNETKGGIYIEGVYPDGSRGYYAFGIR